MTGVQTCALPISGLFQLTAAGRELCEIARTSLTRLRDFERHRSGGTIEIHLGAGESILVWLLLPRLGEMLAIEPKVVLTLHNLRSDETLRRLREGRLDFGILRTPPKLPSLKSLALRSVEYALFVPKPVAGKRRPHDLPGLLSKVPLALLEGTGEVNLAVAHWAEGQGVRLRTPLRCTSLIQVAEAVKRLGMAAVLPTWAESTFEAGSTVRIELPELHSLSPALRLVWSKRQGGIRPFLDRLARLIASCITDGLGVVEGRDAKKRVTVSGRKSPDFSYPTKAHSRRPRIHEESELGV